MCICSFTWLISILIGDECERATHLFVQQKFIWPQCISLLGMHMKVTHGFLHPACRIVFVGQEATQCGKTVSKMEKSSRRNYAFEGLNMTEWARQRRQWQGDWEKVESASKESGARISWQWASETNYCSNIIYLVSSATQKLHLCLIQHLSQVKLQLVYPLLNGHHIHGIVFTWTPSNHTCPGYWTVKAKKLKMVITVERSVILVNWKSSDFSIKLVIGKSWRLDTFFASILPIVMG